MEWTFRKSPSFRFFLILSCYPPFPALENNLLALILDKPDKDAYLLKKGR
jgi:hypothetical protein